MKTIARYFVIFVILLQAVGGRSVSAASINPTQTSPAPSQTVTESIPPTSTPTSYAYPAPGSPTPNPTQTPITIAPSGIPEDTATPVPTVTMVTPGAIGNTLTPLPTDLTATPIPSQTITPTPGTTETITPIPTDGGTSVVPTSGGTVTGLNGALRMVIPDQALSEAIQVSITQPAAAALPAPSLSGHPFEIDAVGQTSQTSVHHFQKGVTLILDYSGESLWAPEDDLVLKYYDETGKDWVTLPSWVDKSKKLLYAVTDHLTLFDFDVQGWQAPHLPKMDAAQVSSYAGGATYSIPIDVPEAPGGLKPSLALTYNSQVVDGSTVLTQAGWAGMGWSIETGYIERNMNGTDNYPDDDTFNIVLNGVSSLLLKDANGTSGGIETYHTADETFMRIQHDTTNDKWIVADKTGNTYIFGDTSGTRGSFPLFPINYQPPYCYPTSYTWYWGLSKTTNAFSQSLTYTYNKESKGITAECNIYGYSADVAVYPQSITYSNSHYRVWFASVSDRTEFPYNWDINTSDHTFYERSRLTEIDIQQDADGNWNTTTDQTLIRKYVLTYATTGTHIFPGYTWTEGGKTLTLTSVQEFGLNGSSSLPATTFTYDDLHLTQVANGYGGSVAFTYQIWYETDAGDLNTWKDEPFCQYLNGSTWSSTNQWSSPSSNLYCGAYTLKIHHGYYAYHDISIRYSQPGAEYVIQAVKGGGPDYKVGYTYTTGSTNTTLYSAVGTYTLYFTLPSGASSLSQALADCTTQTQDCEFTSFKIKRLVTRYRVTQKSISDGVSATPQVFTYRYDDAATNDTVHSAAAQITPTSDNFVQTLSDYRGNSSTTEIGPDGKVTTNFYYQDDAARGQTNNTIVSKQSFYDPFDATNTTNWNYTPSSMADHTITRVTGDNALKTTNPAASWDATLTRQGPNSTLHDGNMVMVQFQANGSSLQSVLGIDSGTYPGSGFRRWGVYIDTVLNNSVCQTICPQYYDGANWTYGPPLVSQTDFNLKPNAWYVLMLIVDGSHSFMAVWQRDNPDIGGTYTLPVSTAIPTGWNWCFKEWTWNGTVYLDEYSEGNLYTWNRTFYKVCNPSGGASSDGECPASIALSSIPAPIGNYNGLAIYWVRTVKTQSMDFEGHGSFTGSQVQYSYDKSLQALAGTPPTPTQFGNQTGTIEYAWDGSTFATLRSSQQQYYPNITGVYLVGLPGYLNYYKCASSCNNSDNGNLVTSTWYTYDNHATNFSTPPTVGILTGKRVMTHWAGPGLTNPMYADETYTYDSWGNQNSVTKYQGEGTWSAIATTGAETTTTCYSGTVDPPSYNASCPSDGYSTYQAWQRDPAGNIIQWAFDPAQGLPKKEIDPNGISNPSGYTTTATYDGFGRLLTIRRPGDEDTNYRPTIGIAYFDTFQPFLINIEVKLNNGTTYAAFDNIRKFYNGLGQLIQQQTAHITINTLSLGNTSRDVVVDYQYDAYGKVVKQTVPYDIDLWHSGNHQQSTPFYTPQSFTAATTTVTALDILGRPLTVTAPDATAATYTYSIDTTNDASGKPGSKTDQKDAKNNHTVTIQYGWGKTTTLSGWGPTTVITTAIGNSVTYGYDVNHNLTSEVGGSTATMSYDMAGRKIGMNDPDMGGWSYIYDAVGNLVQQTDAKSQITCLYYDGDNRLTGKFYQPSGACPTNPTMAVTYTYDQGATGKGHRTAMSVTTGSTNNTNWTYDARGRVATEVTAIDLKSYTTSWTYDSADNVVSMTYPTYSGGTPETVHYTYLSQMVVDKVCSGGTSDCTGSVYYVQGTTYDAAGRTISRQLQPTANTITTTFTYNPWTTHGGRLSNIATTAAGTPPTTIQNLTYGYDGVGNVTSLVDTKAGESLTFTYDNLNRLSTVTGAYTDTLGYDPSSGDLTTKGGTNLTYGPQSNYCPYNALSKPHAVVTAGTNTYCYDPNGNMVTRTIGGVTYTLTYDYENRLTGVAGVGITAAFVYDADGNRVKTTINNGTPVYTIGNYFETDDTQANTKFYYYEGSTQIAMRQNGTLTYLFSDQLGSTTYATDANGNLAFSIKYNAWGQQRASSGTVSTAFQYTDQRNDSFLNSTLGLYFYNAREYDPSLGRFIQADSVVQNTYNPQDWDRYAYAHNNSIVYNDPSGHDVGCPGQNASSCSAGQYNTSKYAPMPVTLKIGPVSAPIPYLVGPTTGKVNFEADVTATGGSDLPIAVSKDDITVGPVTVNKEGIDIAAYNIDLNTPGFSSQVYMGISPSESTSTYGVRLNYANSSGGGTADLSVDFNVHPSWLIPVAIIVGAAVLGWFGQAVQALGQAG